MAKWVLLDAENYVQHIEVDPTNTEELTAWGWFESSDDSVQDGWYWNGSTFSSAGTYAKFSDLAVAREERDHRLLVTDWTVLEDSPWEDPSKATELAEIKTYRQQLRDLFNDPVPDLTNFNNWPVEPDCLRGIDRSTWPS